MEILKPIDPGQARALAVEGCTDIFKLVHRGIDPDSTEAFRISLRDKNMSQINDIAERLVRSTEHRTPNGQKNGNGTYGK